MMICPRAERCKEKRPSSWEICTHKDEHRNKPGSKPRRCGYHDHLCPECKEVEENKE
jgi:hypothetical protein